MIRLGTVAAIGFEDFDPPEWLGCFRQLGCQVVQAYRNQAKPISVAQMRDAIEAGGMPCDSLHGVFGEAFDPSSPDEAVRRFAVDTYKSEADVCHGLGGTLVVVHCATIRREGVSAAEAATRVEQLKKSIDELGRFGASCGMDYAFENLPGYHAIGWDVGQLAGVLRQVAAPNTGMCFDTGHAHMVGDVADAIAQVGDQIAYVHVSDNSGEGDEHEMITYGTIDVDAMAGAFRKIGYSGTFMLEVFYSAERLRALIDEGAAERLKRFIALAHGREG